METEIKAIYELNNLSQTDPEIAEVLEHFLHKDVDPMVSLDEKDKHLVLIAALIPMHADEIFTKALKNSIAANVTPIEIKEVVYQSIPYTGIARAISCLKLTNEYFQAQGISMPLKPQVTTNKDTRFDKGLALQKSIFKDTIDHLYETSPKDQIHIQKYLSANCFGDYYTRSGLDVKTRELITFAMLIALGGCEPQVIGHIQGNFNVGNDAGVLLDVVTYVLPYIGYPRTLNAIRCINECRNKKTKGEEK